MEIYRAAYPVKRGGDFHEIAWSLLHGVLVSSLVKLIDDSALHHFLKSNRPGFPDFRFLCALLVVGLFWGSVLVVQYAIRVRLAAWNPIFKRLSPDPQCVWAKINRPTDGRWATIFLDDGSAYSGFIESHSYNPELENQDLLLGDACRVDDQVRWIYAVDGPGVYVNLRNIKRIEYGTPRRPDTSNGQQTPSTTAITHSPALPSSGQQTPSTATMGPFPSGTNSAPHTVGESIVPNFTS